jgi:hypothetical protein
MNKKSNPGGVVEWYRLRLPTRRLELGAVRSNPARGLGWQLYEICKNIKRSMLVTSLSSLIMVTTFGPFFIRFTFVSTFGVSSNSLVRSEPCN